MKSSFFGQAGVLVVVLTAAAVATPSPARADWHIETVDSAGNVGVYPSLAIDPGGNPHVAYCDWTASRIKYAKRIGGIWQTEFISPLQGAFPSLALDSQGRPHISWNQWVYHGEPVMYTYWDGAQWITQQVPYEGWAGRNNHSSLALTASGLPRLAVVPTGTETWTDRLVYLAWDGSSWSATYLTFSGGQSGRPRIALDCNDNPRIAWPCNYGGPAYLWYFWSDGSGWSDEMITNSVSLARLYEPAALALEADGTPHVAFVNTADTLIHGRRTGSTWVLDDQIIGGPPVQIGISLALDAYAFPHVAYYYAGAPHSLKYAHRTTSAWCVQTVDDSGADHVGYYSSIAIDPNGNPHICYWDETNDNLKYAWWEPSVVTGDLDCSGCVDFGDINPFVQFLANFNAWQATYPGCNPLNGDINGDGTYGQGSFGDINPFVALLSGSP